MSTWTAGASCSTERDNPSVDGLMAYSTSVFLQSSFICFEESIGKQVATRREGDKTLLSTNA